MSRNEKNGGEELSIRYDGQTYLVYNASRTILAEGESIAEAYNRYREKSHEASEIFKKHNLTYGDSSIKSGSQNIIRVGSEKSIRSGIFTLITVILVAVAVTGLGLYSFNRLGTGLEKAMQTISDESKDTVHSLIRTLPSTMKDTLLYDSTGAAVCYPCAVEDVLDGLLDGTSDVELMRRIHEKMEMLEKAYGFDE